MKAIILSACVLFSVSMAAQEKPKRENTKIGSIVQATVFHDNGTVAQRGAYNLNNELHGAWTSYDAQGALIAQGAYAKGKRTGTWFFYNDQEIKQVQYQDGRMTQVDRMAKTDTRVVSQFE